MRLTLRGNQLEVVGSDADLSIEVSQTVAGSEDGSTQIPSRLAVDIVRAFDPGAVRVESDDQEVKITSGKAEFDVRVPVGADVMRLTNVDADGITLPASPFAEGLRQVVPAALRGRHESPAAHRRVDGCGR